MPKLAHKIVNILNKSKCPSNPNTSIPDSGIPAPRMPDIKAGGRLKHFSHEWKKLNSSWVSKILQNGVKLPFKRKPPTKIPSNSSNKLPESISSTLQDIADKGAIAPLPKGKRAYVSNIFPTPKLGDKVRIILNLKRLNKNLEHKPFKMLTLSEAISALEPNLWACKLDLSDAFLHVPVHKDYHKFMAFRWDDQIYTYNCLAFGPSVSPFYFEKVMRVPIAHARLHGIKVLPFVDDLLIVDKDPTKCKLDTLALAEFLTSLGLLINYPKSNLIPSQQVKRLGLLWDFAANRLTITAEKKEGIIQRISSTISSPYTTRRQLEQLVGYLLYTTNGIRDGKIKLHPIQTWIHTNTSATRRDSTIKVDQTLIASLQPWFRKEFLSQGVPLKLSIPTEVVCTDSPMTGYGAVWGHLTLREEWSSSQKALHINHLELLAVLKTAQSWGISGPTK